jgi:thiol-disulfide isomerase/thioredoxin
MTRSRSCWLGVAILPVVVAACGGGPAAQREARERIHVVAAQDVQGLITESRGRVVLVNVWATWCDPCRDEFPGLVRLRKEIALRDFNLILVSADFASQRPQVERFLAGQGVDFPTYLKNQGDNDFIAQMSPAWSGALPATWLYRRDGTVAEFWEGGASFQTLSGKVRALLDEAVPAGGH